MIQFFSLQASFIGWSILNELTFGILGIAWWNAYAELTYAGFYDEIVKKKKLKLNKKNPIFDDGRR